MFSILNKTRNFTSHTSFLLLMYDITVDHLRELHLSGACSVCMKNNILALQMLFGDWFPVPFPNRSWP